jgi:cellulose biosynthesis protein BcsQ
VILVTEPALYSVIAADRARKAILEISAKLSPRLELLGVVVNRFRPQSHEHDYRIKELKEIFGDQLLMPYFEERAAVQQATGAARPIHSWPAEGAAEIARGFDWLLAGAISELEQAGENRSRVGVVDRSMRGSALDEIIEVQEVKEKRKKKRWWSRKSS